jgi:RWP-RK domain
VLYVYASVKRLCRKHGISKWPYRQLLSLDGQLSRLQVELQQALATPPPLGSDGLQNVSELQERIAEMRDDRAAIVAGKRRGDDEQQPLTKKPSRASAAAVSAAVAAVVAADSSSDSESEGSEALPQPLERPLTRPLARLLAQATPVSGSHCVVARDGAHAAQQRRCSAAAAASEAMLQQKAAAVQQQQYQQQQQLYQQHYQQYQQLQQHQQHYQQY